jgi:pimeloyl-ACP methyl ester carboxylesterase
MILALIMTGCTPMEVAPTSWPAEGCTWAGLGEELETKKDRFGWLVASDGVELRTRRKWPRLDCMGAVVMAPPGFSEGNVYVGHDQANNLVKAGLMVVSWDPRGRGESGGEEDHNGHRGQDDLAELLRLTASLSNVDPDHVLLLTRSFGGALGAGALARHPDLAVRAWVDYETPAWVRSELVNIADHVVQRFDDATASVGDVEAWWAEREPAGMIAGVEAAYVRIQGIPDHAQGDYIGHARAMVDNASSAASIHFNDVELEPPIGEDLARELAIDGGVESGAYFVTEQLLRAVE